MSTLFTKIINGEIPGRFVWSDAQCVGFLSIGPLSDGHTLVVPRAEINEFTDAPDELVSHLTLVATKIGRTQKRVFNSARAGLMIAGFEVPHLHVHVWPTNSLADFDLANAAVNPDPAQMDANAQTLRDGLRADGHSEFVPAD
ncbi:MULTISPECIES: HIT family protein [Micrococcaceae]|uniref:HIT domain-containing protein n=1 Tax=Glutamicibacter soli TaxID=453836 RepID=A0A365YBQ6_9MICC|nr:MULTISPECIES: HIT family protein [Micrococcaceae]ALD63539.1 diadenosine tetraphosphate hydrolase [Arthrobacter sp. LS16]ALQ31191.1 diadenosine tetraphosphate hydrolase [Arthrobacter sp. YC-RL1]KLI87548.1 diadenosine tetraphosphate hydrolase [Arthrobacter sp. YC-RL1]NAZ16872.1 HIT domain-containing protein [Glutamicibacter soli]RBL99423.1 HIT family protein [Glutamicibacter soli]